MSEKHLHLGGIHRVPCIIIDDCKASLRTTSIAVFAMQAASSRVPLRKYTHVHGQSYFQMIRSRIWVTLAPCRWRKF